jgi:hypothetical protein
MLIYCQSSNKYLRHYKPRHYYHPLNMSITTLEVAGWRQIGNQVGLAKRRKAKWDWKNDVNG